MKNQLTKSTFQMSQVLKSLVANQVEPIVEILNDYVVSAKSSKRHDDHQMGSPSCVGSLERLIQGARVGDLWSLKGKLCH